MQGVNSGQCDASRNREKRTSPDVFGGFRACGLGRILIFLSFPLRPTLNIFTYNNIVFRSEFPGRSIPSLSAVVCNVRIETFNHKINAPNRPPSLHLSKNRQPAL